MKWSGIRGLIWAACLGGAALPTAEQALAEGAPLQRTAWSTYLRSGPGETYPVLDELMHDTPIAVLGCNDRWCHIQEGSIFGYIDKDALALPRPSLGSPPTSAPQNCVSASQTGWRHPVPTQFCQTGAVAAAHP